MSMRRKNLAPVHGWLVMDKPHGLTSTQALGKARRYLNGDKVGHGGTLDPLATGILPLAFGEATKMVPFIMDGDKEYEFTVRWGEQRDTDDAEGKVTATSNKRPTPEQIQDVLKDFIGTIEQTPPAFSAIKLEGQRAYDLARAGAAPEMKPRPVLIRSLIYVDSPDANTARFHVHCGKGMYVRSLARDLAIKLGTYGYIAGLRRTRVGPFTLDQAISLEKLEELSHNNAALTALLALRAALDDIPGMDLSASEAQRLRSGQSILIRPQHGDLIDAKLIFAEHQGVPVALIEPKAGSFRVVRGFSF
ncbi:MAG TPA: tRNA pseudouridine(55) synthase TruB [Alphaproteobacteria bacterium]|nr:tRNA pseudouridine(55) synthase TruB [Alphaproteobacteria bacterium]